MQLVKESTKERWYFDGRREVQGRDCYVWKRYLDTPDPETGYTTLGIAHPVDSFYPGRR